MECEKIGDCIGGTILGWFLAAPVFFCVVGIRCCLICRQKKAQGSQAQGLTATQGASYAQAPV